MTPSGQSIQATVAIQTTPRLNTHRALLPHTMRSSLLTGMPKPGLKSQQVMAYGRRFGC